MIGSDLSLAAQFLSEGKLVAIPTETVYGLAANALDPVAVSKIFELKGRPEFNPLILHISGIEELDRYVEYVPDKAIQLAEKFWPGPLSLLLPKKMLVPDIVTSGLGTVVVRVPNHFLAIKLLEMIEFPLAAPSANPFKRISPTLPEHVHKAFGSKLPYILDGGKTKIGLESSILSFTSPEPLLLRHGAISLEELEAVCGPIGIKTRQTSDPQSPGQLQQHYSPGKPLYLVEDLETSLKLYAGQKISVLLFGKNEPAADYVYHLSRKSDLREAASNLFECLHQADDDRSDLILVQTLPDEGLGRAINDRLSRASSKEE